MFTDMGFTPSRSSWTGDSIHVYFAAICLKFIEKACYNSDKYTFLMTKQTLITTKSGIIWKYN